MADDIGKKCTWGRRTQVSTFWYELRSSEFNCKIGLFWLSDSQSDLYSIWVSENGRYERILLEKFITFSEVNRPKSSGSCLILLSASERIRSETHEQMEWGSSLSKLWSAIRVFRFRRSPIELGNSLSVLSLMIISSSADNLVKVKRRLNESWPFCKKKLAPTLPADRWWKRFKFIFINS